MRVNIGEKGVYHIYKYYKKTVNNPVEFKVFRKILFTHNKLLMQQVLEEGHMVRLPARLGRIRVRKTEMNYKQLKFDYGTYNKTGVKSYHVNTHSDDFKVRIFWEKSMCIVKGKTPWSFTPSRYNKRKLGKLMQETNGHNKYAQDI